MIKYLPTQNPSRCCDCKKRLRSKWCSFLEKSILPSCVASSPLWGFIAISVLLKVPRWILKVYKREKLFTSFSSEVLYWELLFLFCSAMCPLGSVYVPCLYFQFGSGYVHVVYSNHNMIIWRSLSTNTGPSMKRPNSMLITLTWVSPKSQRVGKTGSLVLGYDVGQRQNNIIDKTWNIYTEYNKEEEAIQSDFTCELIMAFQPQSHEFFLSFFLIQVLFIARIQRDNYIYNPLIFGWIVESYWQVWLSNYWWLCNSGSLFIINLVGQILAGWVILLQEAWFNFLYDFFVFSLCQRKTVFWEHFNILLIFQIWK